MMLFFRTAPQQRREDYSIYFEPLYLCCSELKRKFNSGDMYITEDRKIYHTADTRSGQHLESCPHCNCDFEIIIKDT